jgi:uncharacterized protein (DUF58 family)
VTIWRRIGIGPFAFAGLGMAVIAMLLSRGAGSGWLVVVAAAFLGVIAVGAVSAVCGLLGVRVALVAPTDATAGERIHLDVIVRAWVPQLRTITFRDFDDATHPVNNGRTSIALRADHRSFLDALTIEMRSGITLGIVRPSARAVIPLATPLAIGPRPTPVPLSDAVGFDAAADVRSVRNYVAGDPARLVHWRSTARRGELMVRELEVADHLQGVQLVVRVTLTRDSESAEAAASRAAGLAIVSLDAGLRVQLLTFERDGSRLGAVTSRRDVGRRLAAAVPGEPAPAVRDERTRVVEIA